MSLLEKIKKSQQIIKLASKKWKPSEIAVAWTGGKDSTVVLHLIKETCRQLRDDKLAHRSFSEVGMDSTKVKKGDIPYKTQQNILNI